MVKCRVALPRTCSKREIAAINDKEDGGGEITVTYD